MIIEIKTVDELKAAALKSLYRDYEFTVKWFFEDGDERHKKDAQAILNNIVKLKSSMN